MNADFLRGSGRQGLLAALCAAAFVGLCGCNEGGLERAHVQGNVTLDGKPLADGAIRFVPIGETRGPTWGAVIKDGKYATAGAGVPVGTLLVEIEAHRPLPGYSTAPEASGGVDIGGPPLEQYLPAKYNTASDLQITIEPGSSALAKDFALESN